MPTEPASDKDVDTPSRGGSGGIRPVYVALAILILLPITWLIARAPRGASVSPPTVQDTPTPSTTAAETAPPSDSAVAQFNKYTSDGLSYYQKRDWENAEVAFREALKRVPRSALGLSNLGSVLNEKRDYEAAIPYLQLAVQIDPTLQIARNNLAWATSHRADQRK